MVTRFLPSTRIEADCVSFSEPPNQVVQTTAEPSLVNFTTPQSTPTAGFFLKAFFMASGNQFGGVTLPDRVFHASGR